MVLAGAYGLLALYLAKSLFPKDTAAARPALGLFALLWLCAHTVGIRDALQTIIPDGLAGQYLLGDYYQPCCFGVLLLAAVAAYGAGRLAPAAACLIAAPLFHPAYIISSALTAVGLAAVPANTALGIPRFRRLAFLLLVAAGVGAYALWNFYALTSGDPAVRDAAYRLMAEERIPQHALPSRWSVYTTAAFFTAGVAAAVLGRRSLAGQVLGVLLGLVAAAIFLTLIADSPTVAVAAPWRVSAVLAPLSWIILLAIAAKRLGRRPFFLRPLSRRVKKVLAIAIACACLGGIAHLALDYNKKEFRRDDGLVRYLEHSHRHGRRYLVPPEEKYIRLEAGVPVYATLKSHPTRDSEFLAWHDRIEAAQAVYAGSEAALERLTDDGAITHIAWPAAKGPFPFAAQGKKLYGDRYFSLWQVP